MRLNVPNWSDSSPDSSPVMTDEDYRRQRLAETEPWRLEQIGAAEWIARDKRDLCSLEFPLAREWEPYGELPYERPYEEGVYFLFDERGGLLYIGKATSIEHRFTAHWKANRVPFAAVAWRALPVKAAEILEAYLIGELEPPCNNKFCVNMTRWHKDVAKALAPLASPNVAQWGDSTY